METKQTKDYFNRKNTISNKTISVAKRSEGLKLAKWLIAIRNQNSVDNIDSIWTRKNIQLSEIPTGYI